MLEEDMNNDPNEQENQGNQSYFEIWFLTIIKLQQHTLLKHYLIQSQSKKFISHIQVHIKACISSVHMIFFCHLDVHMAPLEVFLYLKEFLFFQVE